LIRSRRKSRRDPFWQGVLDTTHQQFIAMVKQGRGERLKDKEHPELFSGLVWSGEQAKALGLVDGLGSASYVAREIVGEGVGGLHRSGVAVRSLLQARGCQRG
jgi:protease-4